MTYSERVASMSRDELAKILAERDALTAKNDELARQLEWLKKQLFGTSSERRLLDPSGRQLCLGEMPHDEAVTSTSTTVASHTRVRRPRRAVDDDTPRFDDSVPVETIHLPAPVPEDERDQYVVVDEKLTERLAQRPASYVVLRYIRPVLKHKKTGAFACAAAPSAVLEKSIADVSLLAGLAIDKLVYHLPLYRQHQRMKAAGVRIARNTLTGYVQRTAELLEPIYHAQLQSILESDVLAMDETPIKVGPKKNKPPGKRGAMKTGYFWPIYGDRDEVAFPFATTRSHAVVFKLLGEYAGTVLADGYAAYDAFAEANEKVTLANCWAHCRRGFIEAEASEPVLVQDALTFIGRLYEHEASMSENELKPADRLVYRREHAVPVVDAFFAWLHETRAEHVLLPTSPFTKAIDYALEREVSLRVFLQHPGVSIDTNHLERAIRPIALGRKNWLFCWSELGAEHVGMLQSLLATCRLHRVDPYTYLVDVLQRVYHHPAKRVHELTPRHWKSAFADDPMRSDLDRSTSRSEEREGSEN